MKKILLYDIETTPLISYTWGRYEQNVIGVKKEWELLCFAYKWLGDKEVRCITRAGEKTDKALTKKLWKLMDEADIVVAHNANEFDNKKASAKFIEHGLNPPAPYQSVDTLKLARRKFKFSSHKLDDLGTVLGLGNKIKLTGIDVWLGCMANDKKSWGLMTTYNKQDVALLEKVYLKLRPWDDKHPNIALRERPGCPKCGGINLSSRGISSTLMNQYRRYQCRDCGGWARGRLSATSAKPVLVNS